jgi:hypothetical protein
VYSNDNVFGRKEVVELDDKLKAKSESMEKLVAKVLRAMDEVIASSTELELEREERKYRASLADSTYVKKAPKQAQE